METAEGNSRISTAVPEQLTARISPWDVKAISVILAKGSLMVISLVLLSVNRV